MAKKPTKIEINGALRAITEQLDLIDEIRRTEGSREANANACWGDTVRRMRQAIETLRRAGQEMPERLRHNWTHWRNCGWHDDRTAA